MEPRVKGKIRSNLTNPKPTRGIKELVNTDEDWTNIVKAQPIIIARYPVSFI